ncbi:MAG: GIY-YIG nuclease family protein [Clostridia bacterium]|nr:GIY-YIG nuclease family protein [Clostridia bacterium]
MYYTYMIRTEGGSLYTGIAKDLFSRMKDHAGQGKKCAKYTRSRKLAALEALWSSADRSSASRLEYYLKTLTKKEKEALLLDPKKLFSFLPMIDKEDFIYHPKASLDIYLKMTDLSRI